MSELETYLRKHCEADWNGESPVRLKGFNRENFPQLFAHLGLRTGAEIGVREGYFSKLLCEGIPGIKLYCVDAWTLYRDYNKSTPEEHDRYYKNAQENLKNYDVVFMRSSSWRAVNKFKNGLLDFVYIDSNHQYRYVVKDIIRWSMKVRDGGIVCGDDYVNTNQTKVKLAVDWFVKEKKIDRWYLTDITHRRRKREFPNYLWVNRAV